MRIRVEARFDVTRAAGVDRTINDTTVETRDGKIVSLRGVPDLSDPQTAQFLEYQRTHPQPGGPMPGLPNTGGGGLAAGADRRGALAWSSASAAAASGRADHAAEPGRAMRGRLSPRTSPARGRLGPPRHMTRSQRS